MKWIRISNAIMSDSKYLYLCSMYMPPDNNRFYQKYEYDVFEVLQEQIEQYCVLGNSVVIGDLNGRICKENDYIVDDIIINQLRDNLTGLIDYECELPSDRSTEDITPANKFGRKFLNLCKSSGVNKGNNKITVTTVDKFET